MLLLRMRRVMRVDVLLQQLCSGTSVRPEVWRKDKERRHVRATSLKTKQRPMFLISRRETKATIHSYQPAFRSFSCIRRRLISKSFERQISSLYSAMVFSTAPKISSAAAVSLSERKSLSDSILLVNGGN